MSAKIIDGKAVSAEVKAAVAAETAQLKEKGIVPGLAVIIVGDDPASRVYVNNKKSLRGGWISFGRVCSACADNRKRTASFGSGIE